VTEYLHKFTELSCYAIEVLKTDEQKQDAFLCGLDPEIRTLLGVSVYPDFNTLVNKAITTAKHKKEEIKDKKRGLKARRCFTKRKPRKLSTQLILDRRVIVWCLTRCLLHLSGSHLSLHLLRLKALTTLSQLVGTS
jgi:hypothetical protein